MKNQKKKIIVVLCSILLIGVSWFLDKDRYIKDNIVTIDQADGIQIVTEEKAVSYPFDEKLIDLVSYSGFVVKVDNFFVELFSPYSNKLTKMDMSIRYNKSESTIATADVYQSNDKPEEYILYMNNVYWTTSSKLVDLLELIE
ncbi:hypothetical protein [Fusibacter ferrireducens]|uniref:Uncharacterized protein n=1 Tax=Fusibacter ferrireducens TaxID=2785058 RepID=A0ABR9ZMD2_9FIRM|nr:hypothetical protein [Fusibacter ferrireducens]MBF4691589.1 hypothetical protein [Fusibacter ferrireducens]